MGQVAQAFTLWALRPAVWSYLPLHAGRDRRPVHRLCDAPSPGKGDHLCADKFEQGGRVPGGSPGGWLPTLFPL